MLMVLESFGLEATGVATAEEAVERLATPFDLLITDFDLPGMSGDELLETCRQRQLH